MRSHSQQALLEPANASAYRANRFWTIVLLVVPPVIFYFLLFSSLSVFPFFDDYNSVFEFLLRWKRESGLHHIIEILSFQHNEYRLVFENAIFAAQYTMFGQTNLKVLSVLGDLFVIPLFFVLYLIWSEGTLPKSRGLISLVPVSWLLFQLQYAGTMNWSMAALQNIPALLFVFLSLYLGSVERRPWMFVASLVCLGLSVASSGSGLVLIPVGGVMFCQRRKPLYLGIWLTTGMLVCLTYFYKYNFASSRTHSDHNVLGSIEHLSLPYAAAFLGASAATEKAPLTALILGIVLVILFVLATKDKIYKRNQALYYSALFLILAAVGVSGLRSDGGLATSIASRYRINSALMLILMYLYLAEKFEHVRVDRFVPKALLSLCWLTLVAFTLVSDIAGYKALLMRRAKLDAAILSWQRDGRANNQPREGGRTTDRTLKDDSRYFEPIEPDLTEAIGAGIYPKPKTGDR
jgi:hypothetical protein